MIISIHDTRIKDLLIEFYKSFKNIWHIIITLKSIQQGYRA